MLEAARHIPIWVRHEGTMGEGMTRVDPLPHLSTNTMENDHGIPT